MFKSVVIIIQEYSVVLNNMDGCPLPPGEASKEHTVPFTLSVSITFHWAPIIKCSLCNKSKSHVTFM